MNDAALLRLAGIVLLASVATILVIFAELAVATR
jgi:hypothetical protein